MRDLQSVLFFKARYSLTVLKVPLNPNSINQSKCFMLYRIKVGAYIFFRTSLCFGVNQNSCVFAIMPACSIDMVRLVRQ